MSIETALKAVPSSPAPPATTAPKNTRNELRAAIIDSLRHIDTSAPLYLTADVLTDALLPRFHS